MTGPQSSSLISLALNDGIAPSPNMPFGRLLALSLAFHFALVLLVEILRSLPSQDKPIIAHEISLVNLPSTVPVAKKKVQAKPSKPKARIKPKSEPAPKPVPKAAQPPPQKVEEPAPPPQAPPAPKPEPKVATPSPVPEPEPAVVAPPPVPKPPPPKPLPIPKLSRNPSKEQAQAQATERMKSALGGIELPPNAPEFGELGANTPQTPKSSLSLPQSPKLSKPLPSDLIDPPPIPEEIPPPPKVKRSDKFEKEINTLLDKLKVPDPTISKPVPPPPPRKAIPKLKPQPKPRASLSQDLKKELQEVERRLEAERKRREKLAPPPVPQADPSPEPIEEAKAVLQQADLEQPTTRIQTQGGSTVADKYLARVQQLINRQWIAPPVDLVRSMVVVVKFRLHRSGAVSDVVVEEPSGNEYYDLAGKRAILSADPLPPFPQRISAPYLDTHFTFMVGEQTG